MRTRVKADKTSVIVAIATMTLVTLVALATPAFAHHPFGGEVPTTWFQGMVSGIGHPVLGPDHLAFVIAVGLLAVPLGLMVPAAFVAAALMGTGIHLLAWTLPAPETMIAASVLLFGILLARRHTLAMPWVVGLAALAGVFHGYAYGEAVVGAEMTPLLAYLLGFSGVQFAIAATARALGKTLQGKTDLALRFAGFTLSGIGNAFLSNTVLG